MIAATLYIGLSAPDGNLAAEVLEQGFPLSRELLVPSGDQRDPGYGMSSGSRSRPRDGTPSAGYTARLVTALREGHVQDAEIDWGSDRAFFDCNLRDATVLGDGWGAAWRFNGDEHFTAAMYRLAALAREIGRQSGVVYAYVEPSYVSRGETPWEAANLNKGVPAYRLLDRFVRGAFWGQLLTEGHISALADAAALEMIETLCEVTEIGPSRVWCQMRAESADAIERDRSSLLVAFTPVLLTPREAGDPIPFRQIGQNGERSNLWHWSAEWSSWALQSPRREPWLTVLAMGSWVAVKFAPHPSGRGFFFLGEEPSAPNWQQYLDRINLTYMPVDYDQELQSLELWAQKATHRGADLSEFRGMMADMPSPGMPPDYTVERLLQAIGLSVPPD